ncbi:MAG: DUF4115 domain-containing protein [Desulfobulbaceae bacterium]|nr:DUF4115 domain-containing protein [Desulfobulbaceae bacterium]HIJ79418.1 helix-turn-helix domain-containing protein [Deltaproteobacteria bacterium]
MTDQSAQNEPTTAPEDTPVTERETLGSRFRKQRELLNRTIADAATKTRILPATLKALEEDNRAALPAEVFTRGFIKLYAQYLELDPDQALIWFEELETHPEQARHYSHQQSANSGGYDETAGDNNQFNPGRFIIFALLALILVFSGYLIFSEYEKNGPATTGRQLEQQTNHQPAQPSTDEITQAEEEQPAAEIINNPAEENTAGENSHTEDINTADSLVNEVATKEETKPLTIATDKEVIQPAIITNDIKHQSPKEPVSENTAKLKGNHPQPEVKEAIKEAVVEELQQQPAAAENADISEDTSAAPAQITIQPEPEAPASFNYVLRADVLEMTWLRIKIDDNKPREYTYQPGDKVVWKAKEQINLFVGNAGGLTLTLNDQQLPPLGKSGKTAHLNLPSSTDQ